MNQTNPKQKSIEDYGDLRNGNIKVYFNKQNLEFSFWINPEDPIYTLIGLSEQLKNQEITTTDIDDSNDLHKYLSVNFNKGFFNELSLKTALNNYSITTYGELRDLNSIVVDYVGTNYTFQVGSKKIITDLEAFKTELENQRITISTINVIDDVTSIITELTGTLDTAKAKTKKTSIEKYGDLGTEVISVNYNFRNYHDIKYAINKKNEIMNFYKLKAEAKKQGITLTTEEALKDNSILNGLDIDQLTKAKSIKRYGKLKNQTIEVDYGTDYTFQINGKTVITGLAELNTELNNQGDTEEDYTIDNLPSTLTIDTTKTLAKAKSKENSIATFGNLTSETIEVDYGTDYTFQINDKTVIIGLENLNTELNNQGDATEDDYTIDTLTLTFDETKTVAKAKSKANSIATYGNLTSETIEVDYGTDYTFQINGKTVIIGLAELNTELNNQGDTTEDDYTIDTLTLTFDETKTVAKAKSKENSIATFGNLTSGTIEVDYGTDYTFQINGKTVIIGLAKLNTELNNQGDTTEDDYTIDTLNLTFDETKTLAKAKAKKTSIARYGDLTSGVINVSYNDDEKVIKYNVNQQELNFVQLKAQAENQGITTFGESITEKTLNTTHLTGLVTSELTKAKSIKTYGNLTNLNNVIVDYIGTNYTFKVGSKQKITSLEIFKTELKNQGITISTINDIDDINSIIIGLNGTLNAENIGIKKTTAIISEPDQNSQFNKLLIIPIVSSVIVVIIAIGLLLKKYFKNKKSK